MTKLNADYIKQSRTTEHIKDFESKLRKFGFYQKEIKKSIKCAKNEQIINKQKKLIEKYCLNKFFDVLEF